MIAQNFFHLDRNKYLTSSGQVPIFARSEPKWRKFLRALVRYI